MEQEKVYIAIDLKSFYASCECVQRGLDPLTTNLVVADSSKTEKTICLAVSPSLKSIGISGRARLFEVISKVCEHNEIRRIKSPNKKLKGESYDYNQLQSNPNIALSYIIALPRMALYMKYSIEIYKIYLKYVSHDDIHVYSIDEVFIDATHYLKLYKMSPRDFAMTIIKDILKQTGITATVGIGTNMYLAKIAMDIDAKHIAPDKDGVRIAQLNEQSYRERLWSHRPLTDFWRIGKGYSKKLEANGLYTMGDIARCSINNEALLYKLFGINAELLIDHAWGWEPCTIKDIKSYVPQSSSISTGQVLQSPYPWEKARLIVKEMVDLLAIELVDKQIVTNQVVLDIGYDIENLKNPQIASIYEGEISEDRYGRKVPKYAHGTENLKRYTSSSKLISQAFLKLFDRITDKRFTVRRITVTACRVLPEAEIENHDFQIEQLDIFTDYNALLNETEKEKKELEKERKQQEAILKIRKKYGKNALLKGMNYSEGATTKERNKQIGGHKA